MRKINISELEKQYKFALNGKKLPEKEQIERNMDFVELLLSDTTLEVINYHYDLLKKREYKELYYDIRVAFEKRPEAEDFLIKKLSIENDPLALGDILHLLGILRSTYAVSLARKFIDSDNDYQRKVALYVLGWVGVEEDIDILRIHLINEKSSHLREIAASAHRQMYWRLSELKNKLLGSLKQGFEKEKDDNVIAWIIIMIESIALKRLGLREDREDPDIIHGDVQKSKVKAAKFLAELKM